MACAAAMPAPEAMQGGPWLDEHGLLRHEPDPLMVRSRACSSRACCMAVCSCMESRCVCLGWQVLVGEPHTPASPADGEQRSSEWRCCPCSCPPCCALPALPHSHTLVQTHDIMPTPQAGRRRPWRRFDQDAASTAAAWMPAVAVPLNLLGGGGSVYRLDIELGRLEFELHPDMSLEHQLVSFVFGKHL